jgi:hypothetical protein
MNILMVLKTKTTLAGHVVRMGELSDTRNIIGKPEGNIVW